MEKKGFDLRRECKSAEVMEGESGDAESGKLTYQEKVMNLEEIDEVEVDSRDEVMHVDTVCVL